MAISSSTALPRESADSEGAKCKSHSTNLDHSHISLNLALKFEMCSRISSERDGEGMTDVPTYGSLYDEPTLVEDLIACHYIQT